MTTRRRFLQAAAVAAALPLTVEAAPQEQPTSVAGAMLALVRARFKNLNKDQLKAIERSLRGDLAAAEILRRVRLAPTDEPSTVFVPDVAQQ